MFRSCSFGVNSSVVVALCLFGTVGWAQPPLATPDAPKSVFILPLTAPSDEALAAQVTGALAQHLQRRAELNVVSAQDLADLLQAQKTATALDCEDDSECVARIHERTEADLLLSGSLGRVGKDLLITLSVVETRSHSVVRRIGASAATATELMDRLGDLTAELFGDSARARIQFELPQNQQVSFGVFRIESAGVDEQTVQNLTQFVTVELSRIRGAAVISPADISSILGQEKMRQMLGAQCDDECMINLSGALNVSFIVVGQVGQLDDDYVLALRLIDPRKVQVANREAITVRGPKEELTRAIRTLTRRLVGVDSDVEGQVTVTGPVSGGQVMLDGRVVGSIPARLQGVEPRRSTVRVTRDGYYDWESDVFIQPGEENVVWADLTVKPDPITKKWWFWTLIGGAVAGGMVTAVAISQGGSDTGDGEIVFSNDGDSY